MSEQQTSTYTGINTTTLEGNLTKNAEVKTIQGSDGPIKVLEGRLAFNTRAKGGTKPNYVGFSIWGEKRADALLPKLTKGTPVVITGELSLDQVGENGNTRVFPNVRVDKVHTPRPSNGTQSAPQASEPAAQGEDVPF